MEFKVIGGLKIPFFALRNFRTFPDCLVPEKYHSNRNHSDRGLPVTVILDITRHQDTPRDGKNLSNFLVRQKKRSLQRKKKFEKTKKFHLQPALIRKGERNKSFQ